MKVLKTYDPPTNLKVYTLDSSDVEVFTSFGLSIATIEKLQAFLQQKKIEVKIVETYDPAAGWRGKEFWIDGVDLSLNGFCFSEKRLLDFLAN